jgi:hypothetical protein
VGKDNFKKLDKLFPDLIQKKEVIFFGGLDSQSFDVSYRLYKLNIVHSFIIYEETMSLHIVDVRTLDGFEKIVNYLDSFLYVLDIS